MLEDVFHLVFTRAHDERFALVNATNAQPAERAAALVARKLRGIMAHEVGNCHFKLFGSVVHRGMVLLVFRKVFARF